MQSAALSQQQTQAAETLQGPCGRNSARRRQPCRPSLCPFLLLASCLIVAVWLLQMCSPVGAGPHNEAMKSLFHLGLGLQSFFFGYYFTPLQSRLVGIGFHTCRQTPRQQSGCRRAEAHLQICSAHVCTCAHMPLLVRRCGWLKIPVQSGCE